MPKGARAKTEKALRKGGAEARKVSKGRRNGQAKTDKLKTEDLSNVAVQAKWENQTGGVILHYDETVDKPDYSNNNEEDLAENVAKALAFIMNKK